MISRLCRRLTMEALEGRELLAADLMWGSPEGFNVGLSPWSVAAGDLNGDEIVDLAVANFGGFTNGDVSVLMGRGDGTFDAESRYRTGDKPISIAIADVNNDGHQDLVVANVNSGNVSVLLNSGDGTFSENPPAYDVDFPGHVEIGDVDQDGAFDLVVSSWNGVIQLLKGNGDGTFRDAVAIGEGVNPSSIAVGDFDLDGDTDIAFANRKDDSVSVLLATTDATFDDGGTFTTGGGRFPQTLTAADIDQDGNLDLVTANNRGNDVSVLRGKGDGTFADGQLYDAGRQPSSVIAIDWDDDGDIDLGAINPSDSKVSVLLNEGDGTFEPPMDVMLLRANWSFDLIAADLDHDGDPDLVATSSIVDNRPGRVSVVMNTTESEVTAGDSNHDGVFNQLDVVWVLQSGKYLTGEPATFAEGDWNGDGVFDQLDVVAALAVGTYLKG